MESDWGLTRLAECRTMIDEVDIKILTLLNERTRIVQEIGQVKQTLTLPIYEPKREEQVFENITSHNQGPMPNDAVKRVFERIIDEMRSIQKQRMQGNK
jgi:chorismate mutase-like protein